MAYADYTFYTTKYGGKAITEADFPALANRAAAYIDMATGGAARRISDDDVLTAVRMVNCELAEIFQDEGRMTAGAYTTEGRLSSETVGSWSRTFRSESASGAEIEWIGTRKKDALIMWLGNTGLLKVRAVPRCKTPCSRMW